MTSALVLEYVKVFLSWPVVVGVGGIVGAIYYRHEFRGLVNRIGSIEALGVKVATTQAETSKEEANVDADAELVAVDEPVPPVVANANVSPEEKQRLEAAFQAERAAAYTWEYRYVNYFFAPSTQAVLNWFVQNGGQTTTDQFHAHWANRLTMQNERAAVLDALARHNMITVQDPVFTLTDKGREYYGWAERRITLVPLGSVWRIAPTTYTL